jgi:glycosyltransferase involved in cell wall biosynthesis
VLTAACIPPLAYNEPWALGFEKRIEALCAGERRIAYFYERPDTGTFRYRVFNMIEALKATPRLGISASWFSRIDLPQLDRFIERADVLVICRTRYDAAIYRMIAQAKGRGLQVFFDIDDLIFDPDYVHLMMDTLDQPSEAQQIWDGWFGAVGRFGATLRLCDGAIVPNQFLAARVTAYAPRIVPRIVPNHLNCLQQMESEKIWDAKRRSLFARDGKIHLGYFSGTPTHNRDFEIAAGALAKLLDKDPRIVLRMVGFMEPKGPMLRHRNRIETYPFQDFLNLQRLIGEVEINIAPLQINAFTNCKSELKYFEAAILGTPTIASPTFAFQNAIHDGHNGFLANAHEWEAKIRIALDTVRDPELYAGLSECAYRHAKDAYGWDRYAPEIEAAVFGQHDDFEKQTGHVRQESDPRVNFHQSGFPKSKTHAGLM